MRSVILFTAILLGASSTFAQNRSIERAPKNKSSLLKTLEDATARIEMRGLYANSEKGRASITGANLLLDWDTELTDSWNSRLNVGFQFETGSSDTLFTNEYQFQNNLLLRDAYIKYRPRQSFIEIQAGAIDQNRFNNPIFLTQTPFAGIIENIYYENSKFKIGIEAQQSIANNFNQTQRLSNIDEGTPSFFTERIYLSYRPTQNFQFNTFLGNYRFFDLSNSVANQSRFFGNSIVGIDQNTSRFVYDFSGIFSGGNLIWKASPFFRVDLGGQFLFNREAPDGRNLGEFYQLRTKFYPSQSFHFAALAEVFRTQSDVVPGFYNDRSYGHNNRQGASGGIELDFPDLDVEVIAKYVQANIIDATAFQADAEEFFLILAKEI